MSKHTEGKWDVFPHQGKEYGELELCSHAIYGGNQLQVATIVSDCVPEAESNAKLIRAAPEILEMLKEARCPHCDGSGAIIVESVGVEAGCCGNPLSSGECCGNPVPVPVSEQELEQCQWCCERAALITEIESE